MSDLAWSQREKSIARAAYNKAYRNESDNIIKTVKQKANTLSEAKGIWELEDYLSEKRREMDIKYDYRYSVLIFVLGRLVREGWANIEDLEGLEKVKLERIRSIARVDL